MRYALSALIALFAAPAAAITVIPLAGFTDTDFVELCRDAPGGFNEDCERAVAEIRAGKPGNAGFEYTARNPFATRGFSGPNGQLNITAGSSFAMTMAFDGTDTFSFDVDQIGPDAIDTAPLPSVTVDFAPAETLLIRVKSDDGSFALRDIMLDGTVVGDMTDPGVSYLAVAGFDFTRAFTMTATATFASDIFTSGARKNSDSRLAAQFKFTDLSLVPVPAGAPLLLLGLGALGAMRRRR